MHDSFFLCGVSCPLQCREHLEFQSLKWLWAVSSGGSQGESFSLPFPLSGGQRHSLAPGPPPCPKPVITNHLTLLFHLLGSLDYTGPTWAVHINRCISSFLIQSHLQKLFCHIRQHIQGSGNQDMNIFGGPYSACHTQHTDTISQGEASRTRHAGTWAQCFNGSSHPLQSLIWTFPMFNCWQLILKN